MERNYVTVTVCITVYTFPMFTLNWEGGYLVKQVAMLC